MVEALSLKELQNKVRERYDHDEQRVVGIMLARYDIGVTSEIVEQCYQYWHLNSRKYLDIFWAGYGAYLSSSDESPTKIVLNYRGNKNRAYFDLEAFIEIKEQFHQHRISWWSLSEQSPNVRKREIVLSRQGSMAGRLL